MANRRNKQKPGSIRTRGKWGSDDEGETFQGMLHRLAQEKKPGYHNPYHATHQLPMKQRMAELLAYIQTKGSGGLGTNSINFYQPVLNKLIKNGDVVLKRNIYRSGFNGANRTAMVAAWFPEEAAEDNSAPWEKRNQELKDAGLHYKGKNRGKVRVHVETEMWTKAKDDKLFFEQLAGRADPELVAEVGRTKTKMRKIRKKTK